MSAVTRTGKERDVGSRNARDIKVSADQVRLNLEAAVLFSVKLVRVHAQI